MKKLAIIGANESIAILIEKAKELGYETHVFARACGAPGEKAADFFYPTSTSDKQAILEQCKKIGVCGVCSITSDFCAPVVNFVARHLGLTANPAICETLARNKYEMRRALKEHGLYTPKFLKADETIDTSELHHFHFPIIVKPTDAWSSKGITRLDNPDGLLEAVRYAASFSSENKAIVEEFMDGPEYSAECICYQGKRRVLAFTKKETTGFPHYIETGHIQPSDIPQNLQTKIVSQIEMALSALKIENGAAHAEFRILSDQTIGFMEIGARMGGDDIGTHLTPISTGMDYVKMVIDVACGNAPDFSIVSDPSPVKVAFIINKQDVELYQKILAADPSRIVCASGFDENFSKTVTNSSDRHGYYIYKID